MRQRSSAIIAEDYNDYISQMNKLDKEQEQERSNNNNNDINKLINYQLINFDCLVLNEDEEEEKVKNDSLSYYIPYKIVKIKNRKRLINRPKKIIKFYKCIGKLKNKKRGFVQNRKDEIDEEYGSLKFNQ